VQGVGFRFSTFKETTKFPALHGWVKNLSDGRVEALVQGSGKEVLTILAWCRQGPPSARVSKIQVIEEEVDLSLPLFEIEK